jgi:hypothetical protein
MRTSVAVGPHNEPVEGLVVVSGDGAAGRHSAIALTRYRCTAGAWLRLGRATGRRYRAGDQPKPDGFVHGLATTDALGARDVPDTVPGSGGHYWPPRTASHDMGRGHPAWF